MKELKKKSVNNKSELIIYRIKSFGEFVWLWPDNVESKLHVRIRKNFVWFLWMIILLIGRTGPLFQTIYNDITKYHHISPTLVKHFGLSLNTLLSVILWKYYEKGIRVLLSEVMNDKENLKNNLFYKNLIGYVPLCSLNGIFCAVLFIFYTSAPFIIINTELPVPGWYPFTIELYSIEYFILYAYTNVEIFRTTYLCATVPFILMILFSYTTTKLDVLSLKLTQFHDVNDLRDYIKEHKKCIRLATQLNDAVRFIIFKSYVCLTIVVIFGGVDMVLTRNFVAMLKTGLIVFFSLLQVYLPAWFADNLYVSSQNIAWAVYNSNWSKCTTETKKTLLILMCRAQRSLNISISGIIPVLNKNFYKSYLSFVLSYYMTLRVLYKSS